MITIYNERHNKEKTDDHVIREQVEDFFESHKYLDFTNILVWIKEVNPENSRGQVMFECAVEARIPHQDPVYVSKQNSQITVGVREALDTIKEEIIRKRRRSNDKHQVIDDQIL